VKPQLKTHKSGTKEFGEVGDPLAAFGTAPASPSGRPKLGRPKRPGQGNKETTSSQRPMSPTSLQLSQRPMSPTPSGSASGQRGIKSRNRSQDDDDGHLSEQGRGKRRGLIGDAVLSATANSYGEE